MREMIPPDEVPIKVRVMGKGFASWELEEGAEQWIGTVTFREVIPSEPPEVELDIPGLGFRQLRLVHPGDVDYPFSETPPDDYILHLVGLANGVSTDLALAVHPDSCKLFQEGEEIHPRWSECPYRLGTDASSARSASHFTEKAASPPTEEYKPSPKDQERIRVLEDLVVSTQFEYDEEMLKAAAAAVIRKAVQSVTDGTFFPVTYPRVGPPMMLRDRIFRMLNPCGLSKFATVSAHSLFLRPPREGAPSSDVYDWTRAIEPWLVPLEKFKVPMNKAWSDGPLPLTGNKLLDLTVTEGLKLLRKVES